MCFLLGDMGERIYELIRWAITDTGTAFTSANPYGPTLPNLLIWVVVNPLLVLLLWLRTTWGRLWSQVVFGIHFLFMAYSVAVSHPELWIYLGSAGRLRLVATLVLDLAVIAYLFSRQAREALDH
jgi:hypothetical protein